MLILLVGAGYAIELHCILPPLTGEEKRPLLFSSKQWEEEWKIRAWEKQRSFATRERERVRLSLKIKFRGKVRNPCGGAVLLDSWMKGSPFISVIMLVGIHSKIWNQLVPTAAELLFKTPILRQRVKRIGKRTEVVWGKPRSLERSVFLQMPCIPVTGNEQFLQRIPQSNSWLYHQRWHNVYHPTLHQSKNENSFSLLWSIRPMSEVK